MEPAAARCPDSPFTANEPAPAAIETVSAPFKEYDEPPVVTRLPSESNITKTYLLVPVEELVVRRRGS